MSIKKQILSENQREGQNTKRIIDRLSGHEEKVHFQPHEKSMTLIQLAKHVVDLQGWFDNALKNHSFDFAKDHKSIDAKDFNELAAYLSTKLEENSRFVEQSDDAFWEQPFKITAGDRLIVEAPRAQIIRFFLTNHLIHHRGQLSVYLRLCNIPVPGLYGPSADER